MKKGFLLITALLIFVAVFCTTGTVMGMEKDAARVDEKYYKQMEKEYVMQVRSYLQEEGYENSGLTLTKVLFEDGSREYTLNVHHKRINKISETEQNALRNKLVQFADMELEEGIGMKGLLVVFS